MEILFSTFLQSLKKQTTEHSYKEWSNVDILNDKILEVWTFVLIFGFLEFPPYSTNIIPQRIKNINNKHISICF